MSDTSITELKAEHVIYYSDNDEVAFFEWLGKIKCVTATGGSGYVLSITVQLNLVGDGDLRDLLALFHRYNINKRQLVVLDRPEFHSWFHDKRKYWYSEVFDASNTE